MKKLIFDTSAILNFGYRGRLELLLERLTTRYALLTTSEVEREILRHPQGLKQHRETLKRHFQLQDGKAVKVEAAKLNRLASALSTSEVSVILLASELSATVALEDGTARKQAAAMKVKLSGTVELMAEGVKRKWCTDRQCIESVALLSGNGFKIRLVDPGVTFVQYAQSFGI
jgi:predicted nucleic acid-binding protein